MPNQQPIAPRPPITKDEIVTNIRILIEIFYGLAIASGLQYVSVYVFDPPEKRPPMGSFWWWMVVWAVVVSILVAVSDWLAYALQKVEYRSAGRVVFDLLFPFCVYLLFIAAFRFYVFILAAMLYSIVGATFFILEKQWNPDSLKAGRGFRAVGYLLVIASCLGCVLAKLFFEEGGCTVVLTRAMATVMITLFLVVTLPLRFGRLTQILSKA